MNTGTIDDVSIDKLVEEYGSPIFVVSAETLRNNINRFRDEFSKKYKTVEIAYSYKTNCLLGILDIIHKQGAWADVASGFEYEVARKLGVLGENIVFNGPCKRSEELKRAVLEGAIVNVDHIDELTLLEKIASDFGKSINIGIRINTDVGIPQLSDRFGFNLESGNAVKVVSRCAEKKLLQVIGVHIHLTSYIIEPEEVEDSTPAKRIRLIWPKSSEMYGIAASKIACFAEEIREKYGLEIKYLDMGGGFPDVDSLTPYAEAIVEQLIKRLKDDLPILILEPGRAIVSNAAQLITTVVGLKEFPNGERGIIVDAGVNILPTSFWKWQKIETIRNSGHDLRETTVYGPLCLQTDIIAKAKLPKMKSGAKLIVKNVGAYNISQSSSFIFPRPAVVLIENGGIKVLRMAETVGDLFLFENRS
ncbi:MAG: alanine racemase [Thermodesulfobacteriota bacterium]